MVALLGVARAARLWRQCRPKEGCVHAATVRESIQVLYGLCNGESSGLILSLLSVACVSHELHARKILDYDYNEQKADDLQ